MICKWRRNRFVGDGSSKTFQLDVTGIDKEQTITAKYHITAIRSRWRALMRKRAR